MSADDPHWYMFKQYDQEPNDWTFRFLEDGAACVETDDHRFVIRTQLVERERTHDRFFTVYYEPADVDPLDEDDYEDVRCPFHQSTSDSIAQNNLSAARSGIEERPEPHVAVVEEDGERTVYEVPAAVIAEYAADLYTRINLETDRDLRALAYSAAEWERHVEIEQAVQEADD